MYNKKKPTKLSQEQLLTLNKVVAECAPDVGQLQREWEEKVCQKLQRGGLFLQHQGWGRHAEVWYAPASPEELFNMPDDGSILRKLFHKRGLTYYEYLKDGVLDSIASRIRSDAGLPAHCQVTYKRKKYTVPKYIDRILKERGGSPVYAVVDEVCRRITTEKLTYLLENRRGYAELANLRRLKEEFVRGIPEDFTLLFPKARSIHRHFIIHVGGTDTGKTHDALDALMAAPSGIYLAPLRLLAMENHERINECGVPCSLTTGEEEILVDGARHISATVEKADLHNFYDVGCIDECQMIGDRERGWAWTDAVLGLAASEIHICTADSAVEILKELITQCEDSYEIVEHKRKIPLLAEKEPFYLQKEYIKRYDALIAFSRKKVLAIAAELENMGIQASVIYGALPYRVRKAEVKRYLTGETKVVVATDAIGMGMNLPIHRIVFLEDKKFDGLETRQLNSQEVKQISGRAGRLGMFAEGYVNSAVNMPNIAKLLEAEDPQVEKAGIQLPEKMLYMPGSMLSILMQWERITDKGVYRRSDVKHEIAVCRAIEANFELEKEQIYHFLHIPFDEEDPELMDLFLMLMQNYVSGSNEVYGVETLTLRSLGRMSLQKLEELYRQLDLCSSFYICTNQREYLPQIQWNREKVCDTIAVRLKKKNAI